MGFPLSDLFVPSRKDKAKLYGTKPVYQTPGAAAGQALAANQENLPAAERLASSVNTFNQQQQMDALRKVFPNLDKLLSLGGDILESRLGGKFSKPELDQQQLDVAQRNIGKGTAGSGLHSNDLAREFGFNRFKQTQESLDSTTRWTNAMAQLTQPALFNIGSSFISPQEQFGYNKLVSDVKAAPNPGARGAFDSKMGALGMILGVYGGAGYQGAYRPVSQQPSAPQYQQPNWTGGYSGNYLAEPSPGFGSAGPYE